MPTYNATPADPFAASFSQARVGADAVSFPVLQWHGGLAHLVGDGDGVKINGGFFLESDRILDLGLDPAMPPPGLAPTTLRLGGKNIPGWGASSLHIAVLFSDFTWEDRATGRLRFPASEYERRKQHAPGTERELRGRTRALVAVRELMAGHATPEPVVLSMRGSYSAAFNAILREAGRMAAEATKLRRRAGHAGAVPREAFWLPIYAGPMEDVGEGANISRVALPKCDIPRELERAALAAMLVEEAHRRPGGTFDRWAEQYGEAWAEKSAAHGGETEPPPHDEPDAEPGGDWLDQLYDLAAQWWGEVWETKLRAAVLRHYDCEPELLEIAEAAHVMAWLRQSLDKRAKEVAALRAHGALAGAAAGMA